MTKTRTVRVCPMMMISDLTQMETCGDDNVHNGIEHEIGNTEENHTETIDPLTVGETIGVQWPDNIMAVQCPTGGHDNILRFEKSESRGDKRGLMTETEKKSADYINLRVVGGSTSVGCFSESSITL